MRNVFPAALYSIAPEASAGRNVPHHRKKRVATGRTASTTFNCSSVSFVKISSERKKAGHSGCLAAHCSFAITSFRAGEEISQCVMAHKSCDSALRKPELPLL